jgi:hypothetical protein
MALPTRSPEEFLESFEHFNQETGDPQFARGLPIIRAWILLRAKVTVSQAELDALIDQFEAADDAGSHLHDLWLHVAHWGRELGLFVQNGNPCAARRQRPR